MIVMAPRTFNGTFRLWYWSQPARQWYALPAEQTGQRTLTAHLPYLTTVAITRGRIPTQITIAASTWTALSIQIADRTEPQGTNQAQVRPLCLNTSCPATDLAAPANDPVLFYGPHTPFTSTAAALAHLNAIQVDVSRLGSQDLRLPMFLIHRGFHVHVSLMAVQANVRHAHPTDGPRMIFDGQSWSPRAFKLLRELNLTLRRSSSVPAPSRTIMAHQLTIVRQLHLTHPFMWAQRYQRLITDPARVQLIEGIGPESMVGPLTQELVGYIPSILVLGSSADTKSQFNLGFTPSYPVSFLVRDTEMHK
jgi:hypothetical protein